MHIILISAAIYLKTSAKMQNVQQIFFAEKYNYLLSFFRYLLTIFNFLLLWNKRAININLRRQRLRDKDSV